MKRRALANSVDPDETSNCAAAFHQVLHCLLKKQSSGGKYFYLESIACDPLICIMNHPKFIVSSKKEESICDDKGKFSIAKRRVKIMKENFSNFNNHTHHRERESISFSFLFQDNGNRFRFESNSRAANAL